MVWNGSDTLTNGISLGRYVTLCLAKETGGIANSVMRFFILGPQFWSEAYRLQSCKVPSLSLPVSPRIVKQNLFSLLSPCQALLKTLDFSFDIFGFPILSLNLPFLSCSCLSTHDSDLIANLNGMEFFDLNNG